MSRIVAILLLAAGLGGPAVSAPAPKTKELTPLARYRFNGNGKDETRGNPDFELKNTSFKDNALYLNGEYPWTSAKGTGYRAVCRTPRLDYDRFTVALRFKADEFGTNKRSALPKSNLITGGTYHRWFSLRRSDVGNLEITMNNQDWHFEIKGAVIDKHKWTVVACGVDIPARKILVYLNGKKAGEVSLPKDFALRVATSRVKDRDKEWSFTNYSNGDVFHGLIGELIIYNKMLTPAEFAAIPLRP